MNTLIPNDEEIGRLIREAGPDTNLPADDLAAIRARARAEWKKHYAPERPRSRFLRMSLPLAAALTGLAFLSLWFVGKRTTVPPAVAVLVGHIERVTGDVRALHADGTVALLREGDSLDSGMAITTGDTPESRVAFRLTAGQSLRLDAAGRLLLGSGDVMQLDRGAVYVDSPAGAVRDTVTIHTAAGDFSPAGTQFEVRIATGGATHLQVREGAVRVNRPGSTLAAQAGQALTIETNGAVARAQIAPDDPAWDWVVDTVPVPLIEGRTLASFLQWVARERGRKLVLEGGLAATAETTTLHGSVEQLSLDDALRTVTLSTGVEARYANGSLIVSPASQRISGAPTKSRPTR
jgi:hypothetical protein